MRNIFHHSPLKTYAVASCWYYRLVNYSHLWIFHRDDNKYCKKKKYMIRHTEFDNDCIKSLNQGRNGEKFINHKIPGITFPKILSSKHVHSEGFT